MSYFVLQLEELLGGVNEDTDTTAVGSGIGAGKFWFPATSAGLQAAPDHMDRSDENRGTYGAPPKLIDNYAPAGKIAMRAYPNLIVPLLHLGGYEATIAEGDGTNAVHTLSLTGSPTGGSFTITAGGETTAALPYNATAVQVKAALEALHLYRPGDLVVAGGALPTAITITYTGRYAGQVVAAPTTTDSLTGGTTPATAIASTTAGATGTVLDPDGNGLAAGAYLITFAKRTTAAAKTAQIVAAYTEHGTYIKGNGYGVSSFAMTAAGEVTVDLMGLYARRVPDPGYTPALDAASILPLRRGDLTLTWMGGSAYTQDFNFTIANNIERGDHLGIASYYPKVLEHTGTPVMLKGSINKRTLDPDDYDAMLDARTFSATARWISPTPVGSSGKNYSMWIEMPAAQYVSGDPEDQTNARRYAANYEFEAAYDETAADDATISIVCGVSALDS